MTEKIKKERRRIEEILRQLLLEIEDEEQAILFLDEVKASIFEAFKKL